jgi:glutaminyl-tRNA synthetase
MSKRKLMELVERGIVAGWDDPQMPTLSGMRRRGYTPEAIRSFCEKIGVSKNDSLVDMALLENCVREDLNEKAPRMMAVLRPLRVVIDNYPEDRVEEFDCPCHPKNPEMGSRKVPFSRVLYIEQDDFLEEPPKKFFRLTVGREVRLRYGYFIRCTGVVKDPQTEEVIEIHCTYDPDTRSGFAPDGRKVDATIHWVSAAHAGTAEVRLYDRLFRVPDPLGEAGDFTEYLNPKSLETLASCRVEPILLQAAPGDRFQFERLGYFYADSRDSRPGAPVFNRTVTLRDAWARIAEKRS